MTNKPTSELIAEAREEADHLRRYSAVPIQAEASDYAELFQALADRLEKAQEEIAIDDKVIEERNRLLRAMECPIHGECVPGAIEKWEDLQTQLREAQGEIAVLEAQLREAL